MNQPVARASHQVRPPQLRGLALLMLTATACAHSISAEAENLLPANKIIAFVRAEGCQFEAIKPKVNAAGEAFVKDKATTWVAVDLPANPDRNVSMLGKPSPYLAAVEANAATSALPGLIKKVRAALGTQCQVDVYSIREGRLISPKRTWQLGEPSPVGKGFITFLRADGISLQTLDSIWGGPHAELILSNRDRAAQTGQPLQGESYLYIRNVVVGRASEDSPVIDGIAETGGVGAGASAQEVARRAQTLQAASQTQAAAPAQGGATPAPSANRNQESAKRFMSLDISKINMFSVQEIILKD
jgi:hypothetical protein